MHKIVEVITANDGCTMRDIIKYVEGTSQSVWSEYLEKPAEYLWNDVWVNIFWKSFINNMERIRDGKPTDLDNAAKNLQVPTQ